MTDQAPTDRPGLLQQTRFRVASATALAAPTNGSIAATRGCASIATAMPSGRPLMRMTAASAPGPITVSVPTIWSYVR